MTDSKNKFGEILKKLRTSQNLTQSEISKIIDTDRSNVANYESGKRLPSLESLINIADFFGVSLDFLVRGDDVQKNPKGGHSETTKQLMAENTVLMQTELGLTEELKEKEEEIKVLEEYVASLKKHNELLEKKLKKK